MSLTSSSTNRPLNLGDIKIFNMSTCSSPSSSNSSTVAADRRLRFACDRCHCQKLRCPRTFRDGNNVNVLEPCSRCVNVGVECSSSRRGKVGRPRKESTSKKPPASKSRAPKKPTPTRTSTPESRDNNALSSKSLTVIGETNLQNLHSEEQEINDPNDLGLAFESNFSSEIRVAENMHSLHHGQWGMGGKDGIIPTPPETIPSPERTTYKFPPQSLGDFSRTSDLGSTRDCREYANGDKVSFHTGALHKREANRNIQILDTSLDIHSGMNLGMDVDMLMFDLPEEDLNALLEDNSPPITREPHNVNAHPYACDLASSAIHLDDIITDTLASGPTNEFHINTARDVSSMQSSSHKKSETAPGTSNAAGSPRQSRFSKMSYFQQLSQLNLHIAPHLERASRVPKRKGPSSYQGGQIARDMAPFSQELIDIARQCLPRICTGERYDSEETELQTTEKDSPVPDSALIFLLLSCYTQILHTFEIAIGHHFSQHYADTESPASRHSDGNPDKVNSLLEASLTIHTVVYLLSRIRRAFSQCESSIGEESGLLEMEDDSRSSLTELWNQRLFPAGADTLGHGACSEIRERECNLLRKTRDLKDLIGRSHI